MQSLAITPSIERAPITPQLQPQDTLPTSRVPLYLLGAIAALGIGAGVAYLATRPPEMNAPVIAGAGIRDAGPDAPVVPAEAFFRMVTGTDRTTNPAFALGPPDGQCAEVAAGGKILLELPNGEVVQTDRGPTPDLHIVVRDDSASYRVDVLVRRNEDQTRVGADVVGSMRIDVDQFERETFRYVRVKNPNRRGTLCVDAVGYYLAP